jgi:hypothetical protein
MKLYRTLYRLLPSLILLTLCLGCTKTPKVPAELNGTWRTEDARYQGKFLQFDESYITTGLGEDVLPKVELITHLEVRREGPGITCVIDARDQKGDTERLTVMYSSQNGGELRLSNPRQVLWKKDS